MRTLKHVYFLSFIAVTKGVVCFEGKRLMVFGYLLFKDMGLKE